MVPSTSSNRGTTLLHRYCQRTVRYARCVIAGQPKRGIMPTSPPGFFVARSLSRPRQNSPDSAGTLQARFRSARTSPVKTRRAEWRREAWRVSLISAELHTRKKKIGRCCGRARLNCGEGKDTIKLDKKAQEPLHYTLRISVQLQHCVHCTCPARNAEGPEEMTPL